MKKLALIVLCITYLVGNAQIPFKKKDKWGIQNEISGKTLVKAKYDTLISVGSNGNRFIVQDKVKRPYEGSKQCYGVINSEGKEVLPIIADSICIWKDGFICFVSQGVSVGEDRWRKIDEIKFYDIDGNLLNTIPGWIVEKLSTGYLVCGNGVDKEKFKSLYKDKRVSMNAPLTLYDKNFIKIDDVSGLEMIGKNGIITYNISGNDKEYTYRENATLKPCFNFYHYEVWNNEKDIIVISQYDKYANHMLYGYIDLKGNKYESPSFSSDKMNDGSRVFDNGYECFVLNQNGCRVDCKLFNFTNKFSNTQKIYLYKNNVGLYRLDDIEVDDITQPYNMPGKLSIKKGDKWGLYDFDEKEMVLPFLFSEPISKMNKGYVLTEIDDSAYRLYDIEGKKIFDVPSEYEIDIENISNSYVRTYRLDGLKITGIFSLKNNNWLFEPGKFGDIYTISGDRFAVEVAPNKYNYVTSDGVVLSTLNNVENSYHAFQDFKDFIKVTFTSGKIGLLNPKTGKWIIPGEYERDIAFGEGTGVDRRIAVQQNSPQGELVSIYTIGGRKIASQFFPYNLPKRNIAIYNFGQKFLYH